MLRQLWPPWPVCRDRPLAGFCTKVSPQDLRPLYKKKLGTCLRVALCDVGDWKEVGWMVDFFCSFKAGFLTCDCRVLTK